MSARAILVAAVVLLAAAPRRAPGQAVPLRPGARAGACLAQEPDTVRMSGIVSRRTYPGAPRYRSVRRGDARDVGYYLDIGPAVCARAGDGTHPARTGVRRVRLVLDSAGIAVLRPVVGQHVVLRGTLSSAVPRHEHAPLLLRVLTPVQIDR